MIDPGKMRHKITVQEYVGAEDNYGDPMKYEDGQWKDVTKLWAAIDPVSGKEFYAAQQSQSEVTHKVRCRYYPGIIPAMRLKVEKRIFQPISVIDWEERHESLLMMCREVL